MRRELLIGAGKSRIKRIRCDRYPGEFENPVTLDIAGNADVIHDLDVLPYPFTTNEFDEIHAYEVLEHCGTQGNWRFFFDQFTEFWRILKPDGYFVGSVPMWDSMWAWGDPGHRRVINKGTLMFLNQDFYRQEEEAGTAATDYRHYYKADFRIIGIQESEHQLGFVLQAVK